MKNYKELAKLALETLNAAEKLIGRGHAPRVNAGVGWNGNSDNWALRNARRNAGVISSLEYRNCRRVYCFASCADLTVAELEFLEKLKTVAYAHKRQLAYAPEKTHKTRESFGKHLVKLGVTTYAARHFIYGVVKQGVALETAVKALKEIKETGKTTLPVEFIPVWHDVGDRNEPSDTYGAAKLCAI